MYGVYFNLYLSNIGFSNTMIGFLTALSTLLLLMAQPFWGVMSDRAKKKNTILKLLFLLSGLSALLYYRSTDYLYVVIINLIFTMFYSTLVPLQDNITLEYLAGTRWDFGKIRMWGDYRLCYHCRNSRNPDERTGTPYILGCFAFYAACFILMFIIPRVPGFRTRTEKAPFSAIKNKMFMCLIGFNLTYSLGVSFFYTYYPIYFESIGAAVLL